MSRVDEVFARLSAVNWEIDPARRRSKARLIVEYLRRAALWSAEFGYTESSPFIDFSWFVDPSVDVDPELRSRVDDFPIPFFTIAVCQYALSWAAATATEGRILPDLPDLFEPVLLAFERGGMFTLNNVQIEDGTFAIFLRGWRDRINGTPIPSLDADYLDSLDAGA